MIHAPSISVALSDQIVQYVNSESVKRFGLIALATDLTTERDFARLIPAQSAAIHTTRIQYENPTTPANLRAMAPRITAAADLILPGENLSVVCYSCTAASVVIGDDAIVEAIHAARPGVPVVTPTSAARHAFAALGVSRIAALTPYLLETSQPMAKYFTSHGLELTQMQCLGLEDDRQMARVSDNTIIEAALKVNSDDAEALFLSCTGLPAVNVIAQIESLINKPVVSSNQASAWMMMQLTGLSEAVSNCGGLFDHRLVNLKQMS